jgi:hypothetical protein
VLNLQVDGDVKGRAVGSGLTTGYDFLDHGAYLNQSEEFCKAGWQTSSRDRFYCGDKRIYREHRRMETVCCSLTSLMA